MIAVMAKEKIEKINKPDSDELSPETGGIRIPLGQLAQIVEIAHVEKIPRWRVLESLLNQSPLRDRFRTALQRKVAEASRQLKET